MSLARADTAHTMLSHAWSTGDLDKGLESLLLDAQAELPDDLAGLEDRTKSVRHTPTWERAHDFQPYVLIGCVMFRKHIFMKQYYNQPTCFVFRLPSGLNIRSWKPCLPMLERPKIGSGAYIPWRASRFVEITTIWTGWINAIWLNISPITTCFQIKLDWLVKFDLITSGFDDDFLWATPLVTLPCCNWSLLLFRISPWKRWSECRARFRASITYHECDAGLCID